MDNYSSLSPIRETVSENDSIAQESFHSLETNQTKERHPTCQFKSDKSWLDCQYHDLECTSIKKPDELENEMEDPPINYDQDILDRIQGSMFGMTLGDALGAHVEFRPRGYLIDNPVEDLQGGGTWGLAKGQFTDDTSMALCLANSLIARQEFNCYDQLVRYQWWYIHGYMSSTGQCFDIGSATRQSLREFADRQQIFSEKNNIPLNDLDFLQDRDLIQKFNVYCSREGVAGNGALMRLAPVPLFFYKYPAQAVELSGISGLITHGDQKVYDACRYYGALIVAALNGETKEQLLDQDFYLNHQHWFDGKELHTDIMNIIQGSYQKQGGYDDGIRGKGYIVNALEAALWAFWSDDDSFKKGALAAVNLGDDTDTTAAIYGQLAGAHYGYQNLPDEWIQQVYAKKFIETLSKWIAYEGQNQTEETIVERTILYPVKPHNDTPVTNLDDLDPQDDIEATTTSSITLDLAQSQDDEQATSPISAIPELQDDQKITPPTTPVDEKPQDDEETTSSTISTDVKPQNDQELTPPTVSTDEEQSDNQKPTPPTSPALVKPQDDEEVTLPTFPAVEKLQNDKKPTPPTSLALVKPQDDEEVTLPTFPAVEKLQDDQKISPPTTPDHATLQDDQKATPPATPVDTNHQDDQNVTSPAIPVDAEPQDEQKITPSTPPADVKPEDDEKVTPPATPEHVKSQDDQNAASPAASTDVESQNDEKITPPTTHADTYHLDDQNVTSSTIPVDTEPQDDQNLTSLPILVDVKPEDETKVTPPATPTDVKPQNDEKITPPTTPAVNTKLQDDQNIIPKTPIVEKVQDDVNIILTTPTYANPEEDLKVTSTILNDIQQEDDQNTIPSTPNNAKSQVNLTTIPTSPQTINIDRYTTYKSTEPSQFSTGISNRASVYEPSYEYESHRSDRARYFSPSTDDSRPFSSESTSYRSATNKPTNLNKNLLLWTIDDVCHWVESFGPNYATYANSFRKDVIDGFRLYNFINDHVLLIEYGVKNEDHRKQILSAIQQLRKEFLNERRNR